MRRLRRAKQLTQEQVCTKLQLMGLNITRSVYSRYETGELNICVSHLIGLTQVFDCDYNAFFENLIF